jgi:quercetin dioxygenase-like cupin family protein
MLIDTSSGEPVLRDVELANAIDPQATAELATPSLDRLMQCVVHADAMAGNPDSPLHADGVSEAGVIVPQATSDGFPAGPIVGWWRHGFNLRQLTLQSGAFVPRHTRAEAEVLFIQSGTLAGDTLTVPIGLPRAFRNTASVPCVAFVVRGTDDPARPVFA